MPLDHSVTGPSQGQSMSICRDGHGRAINYLRVSVTDRCNLRCVYCIPSQPVVRRARQEILRYEEIVRIVEAAATLGVRKVRLTGGEPLVREGLPDLVATLAKVPGIEEISLTTNGMLLERLADPLARAGLGRVNVSLDTLRPERFARITRGGSLEQAWRGINAAERAGLNPIKLNMVVVKGLNDDELEAAARLTVNLTWNVRFIELMPIGNQGEWGPDFPPAYDRFLPVALMRERVAKLGTLSPAREARGNGPAEIYRLEGAAGTIGFISSISRHFCAECNRLRLTADGWLRPCLLQEGEVDLRPALREGASSQAIRAIIAGAILAKPKEHFVTQHGLPLGRAMTAIGG